MPIVNLCIHCWLPTKGIAPLPIEAILCSWIVFQIYFAENKTKVNAGVPKPQATAHYWATACLELGHTSGECVHVTPFAQAVAACTHVQSSSYASGGCLHLCMKLPSCEQGTIPCLPPRQADKP